jgi:glycosyltransferase involved in cell wall biosynthesis
MMKIVGFAEGAHSGNGGLGLVGVPGILGSTALRGHQVALAVGGPPMATGDKWVVSDFERALSRKQGDGAFGIVSFKAWMGWAFAPAMLWRASRCVGAADFVSLHSLYSFPVLAGYLLARLHRKPYGVWPHGVLARVQRRVSPGKKRVYDTLITRWIIRNSAVLFFGGNRERDEAREAYAFSALDANGRRQLSVVIPDGFDASAFAALPPKGDFRGARLGSHQGPLILFLARLNAKKGLQLLAHAMALVVQKRPDALLAIVGPPDPPGFEDQVRRWVRGHGIDSRVVITGLVDLETKRQALADADVFVLPSEAENFGFSVFEAMASHIPVVVSDTLDYSRAIAAAEAGFVIERTPEQFAASILELIAQSDLRRRMGENGARLARRYSLEETASKVERTIVSVLRRGPLPPDLTNDLEIAELP